MLTPGTIVKGTLAAKATIPSAFASDDS